MSETEQILHALGRIEGKVDEIKESAKEHREDDKRRFTEVHKKLDEHSEDLATAKGAKGALLWAAGLVAGFVAFVAPYIAKLVGLK